MTHGKEYKQGKQTKDKFKMQKQTKTYTAHFKNDLSAIQYARSPNIPTQSSGTTTFLQSNLCRYPHARFILFIIVNYHILPERNPKVDKD